MKSLTMLALLMSLSACSTHFSQKTEAILPTRTPNKEIELSRCQPERACLDRENFQNLIKNMINTESYIKQLENLLKETVTPVKGTK